jgi:hypothetical protein
LVTRLSLSQDGEEHTTATTTTTTKTPVRCVSIGKQKNIDNNYTSSTSPAMEDTTPISMSSSTSLNPHSPLFDSLQQMNDDNTTARNIDFDDVALTNDNYNDDDDSDDDLI